MSKIKRNNIIRRVEEKYYKNNENTVFQNDQVETYCFNCGEIDNECNCEYTEYNCNNIECSLKYNKLLNKYENIQQINNIKYIDYLKQLKDEGTLILNNCYKKLKNEKSNLEEKIEILEKSKIKYKQYALNFRHKLENIGIKFEDELDTFLSEYKKYNELLNSFNFNSFEDLKNLLTKYKNHKFNTYFIINNHIEILKTINLKDNCNKVKYNSLNFRKDVFKYLLSKKKLKKQRNIFIEECKSIRLNTKEKILDEIDSILDEINKEYKLVECKYNNCKQQCYDDIGFCLQHYPDICSNCDKIIDKNDRLHSNKKHNIEKCCNSCTEELFFKHYVNEYNYEDILHIIDRNDKFYNVKSSLGQENYFDMERDVLILNDIKNKNDLLEKEVLEFYGYKTDDYNDFTKYKLYNRIIRSKDLLNEFKDKIKYIKVKPSFYAYIGFYQYKAFKRFLHYLLNDGDNNIKEIEIDVMSEFLQEPPSDYEDEE